MKSEQIATVTTPKKDGFGRAVPAGVKPLSTRDLFVLCPSCGEKIVMWSPPKEAKR